jgi:hypothetical protein
MTNADWIRQQLPVCRKHRAGPFPSPGHLKVGIAQNVREGLQPVNGLRIPPEGDQTGWYIWAGEEWSDDPEFFVPLHIQHLPEWCPAAISYLQLPPGWRFLTGPDYEDVWYDPELLNKP